MVEQRSFNPFVAGSNPVIFKITKPMLAQGATHNRLLESSIPSGLPMTEFLIY